MDTPRSVHDLSMDGRCSDSHRGREFDPLAATYSVLKQAGSKSTTPSESVAARWPDRRSSALHERDVSI